MWPTLTIAMLLLAAVGPGPNLPPRDANPAALDSVFARWNRTDGPGCGCAVSRDGVVLYERAFGMADLEHGVPLASRSVFYLASVSKQFTAGSVALLALRDSLSLDEDVRTRLPELSGLPQAVTIRQLLTHTSGIRDYFGLFRLAGDRSILDNERLMAMIARQTSLAFPPGTVYSYSNSNYIILADLVKRISGRSLREFAHDELFEPLGMTRTQYDDDHRRIVPDRVTSYDPDEDGGYLRNVKAYDGVGDGGLLSTTGDLLRWGENLIHPRVGGPTWVGLLTTPGVLANGDTLDYGFGLQLSRHRGARRIGHSGGFEGFRTRIDVYPDSGLVVAVLCNAADADPGALADRVTERILRLEDSGGPAWTPSDSLFGETPVPVPARELAALEGSYWSPSIALERRLEVRDGTLHYVRIGGAASALEPIGEGRFLMTGFETPIVVAFDPRDSGTDAFDLEITGRDPIPFKRITPAFPSLDRLREHAGTYVSGEIQTSFELGVADSLLVLRMPYMTELPLHPVSEGTFVAADDEFSYVLEFTYDGRGRPEAFTVDSGWITGLRFDRR